MSEWDTSMRYAPAGDISDRRVKRWADQARELIQAMEDA